MNCGNWKENIVSHKDSPKHGFGKIWSQRENAHTHSIIENDLILPTQLRKEMQKLNKEGKLIVHLKHCIYFVE